MCMFPMPSETSSAVRKLARQDRSRCTLATPRSGQRGFPKGCGCVSRALPAQPLTSASSLASRSLSSFQPSAEGHFAVSRWFVCQLPGKQLKGGTALAPERWPEFAIGKKGTRAAEDNCTHVCMHAWDGQCHLCCWRGASPTCCPIGTSLPLYFSAGWQW